MLVLLQTIFFSVGFSPNLASGQLIRNTPVDQLIGINARPQDIAIPGVNARLQKFAHVRSFHRWGDDVGTPSSPVAKIILDWPTIPPTPTSADFEYLRYRYNLSFNGNLPLAMDQFYGNLATKASPTLFSVAPIMRGVNQFAVPPLDQKPVNLKLNHGYSYSLGQPFPDPSLLQSNPATSPNDYRSHTINLSMFAARYGKILPATKTTSIKSFLVEPHLQPTELYPNAISLHHIDYLEVYNEPDKEWFDANKSIGHTTHKQWPSEHAAMLSAAYDGHCRDSYFEIPRPTNEGAPIYLGIKNISPTTQVVMGGLANMRGYHLEQMIDWFNLNRSNCSEKLPFDVINYHHYSFRKSTEKDFKFHYENETETLLFAQDPYAATPEEDEIKLKMRYFAFRLKTSKPEVSAKPIWITEIGYDTDKVLVEDNMHQIKDQSPITAYHLINNVPVPSQKAQAQWDMRMLLEAAASKVMDRVSLYEDIDIGPGALYGSTGLINTKGIPKESWYYVQTLRNVLKGASYQGRPSGENISNPQTAANYHYNPNDDASFVALLHEPDIDNQGGGLLSALPALNPSDPQPIIYRFAKAGGGSQIYAIWSPTKTDRNYAATVQFKTSNYQNKVTLITTRNLDENGYHRIWSTHTMPGATNANYTAVQDIPVSETPVFVVLGEEKEDPNPLSVPGSQITVSSGCCNDLKIDFPVKSRTKYTIYYADAAHYSGNVLDLNNPAVQMYEMPLGTLPPISISGLSLLPGQSFYVWVIPDFFDASTFFFGNIPSPLPTATLLTVPPVCNTCVIGIGANQITSTFQGGTGIGQQIFSNILPNPCDQVNAPSDPSVGIHWDSYHPFGSANTITITFATTMRIETAKYYDGQGHGNIFVEYLDCCNQWQPLTSLDLNQFGFWRDAPGLSCICKGLRFYRDNSDAKVYKILLCGQPTTCQPKPPLEPTEPSTEVTDVGTESARLEWTPSWKYGLSPEIFKNYTVAFSDQWTENGTLVNPITVQTGSLNGEVQLALNLQNLNPSTDYRGTIKPLEQEALADCGNVDGALPSGSFAFRTDDLPLVSEERSNELQENYHFICAPNPTSGRTMAILSEPGYYRLEVIEMATSRSIGTIDISETVAQVNLELGQLMSGNYLIRALHRNHAAAYAPVVIIKE